MKQIIMKHIKNYKSFVEKRLDEIKNSDIEIDRLKASKLSNDEKESLKDTKDEKDSIENTDKKKKETKEDLVKQMNEYQKQIDLLLNYDKNNYSK